MGRRPPSWQVVQAVADAENTDPSDLPTPLFETIDTEALDQIFDSPQDNRTIHFEYLEYEITVTAGGDVSVNRE
ncbi:hypothetical protein EGH21_19005 [Halomicroarcula sp. F13]|uniref:Halobacterial output domain-containing protein n=1 Tax=Haloarcula rubra TaxID=2487747 RepID=A0AAW4PXW7_9EURY|nr:HalOD1 output domain-containing protein [Halomicroarcula rubra]MBX0325122.1 hypothetical protein [Halomicroarcula rubra]